MDDSRGVELNGAESKEFPVKVSSMEFIEGLFGEAGRLNEGIVFSKVDGVTTRGNEMTGLFSLLRAWVATLFKGGKEGEAWGSVDSLAVWIDVISP